MKKVPPSLAEFESLEHLYQRPGFLLRRAHQISVAIFEQECAALELTPAQYGVLNVLANSRGIDQSALSRALGLDRVTVLRVAKGLEARGLISRAAAREDGRRLALGLTESGERVFRSAQKPVQNAFTRLSSVFEPQELESLTQLLNKLCTSLASEARAPMEPPMPKVGGSGCKTNGGDL